MQAIATILDLHKGTSIGMPTTTGVGPETLVPLHTTVTNGSLPLMHALVGPRLSTLPNARSAYL
eukprot:SAG31_NODE_3622_length_4059_cov_2.742905_4_plen_64_part_00